MTGKTTRRPVWFRSWRAVIHPDSRPTRYAVEQLLDQSPAADVLAAQLVRQAADLVDSAARHQDPAMWLKAQVRLDELLRRIAPAGGGDGGRSASSDGGQGGLAGLVGRGPTMGDGTVP